MEVVAYEGAADAIRDVLAGHVPMICHVVLPTGNHVKAGRMKGLVVS
jgi:tripartite-type tricarboxylate transporter receptor subunit TctC